MSLQNAFLIREPLLRECYSEHSLDEGSTSRAASYVGLVWGDNTVTWGAGTDTDIIVAGIRALVSAINNR